jgi:DnaJ-class molecular chaperone
MPRNHYIVLGIDRGANPSQIKRAYRNAIKRYHPDKGGANSNSHKFIEAKEAYEVLSDIDKRRAYDIKLNRHDIPIRIAEPGKVVTPPSSLWNEIRTQRSILDAFFEGFVPGFYRHFPSRSGDNDLYMEIVLSPEEAHQGGVFPVTVPVMAPCPDCSQDRWWYGQYCRTCRGYEVVKSRRQFNLTIPPDTRDGMTAEVAMSGIGLNGVKLIIDVQVR